MQHETNKTNSPALDALAARCASDPFFLASALAAYQQRHGLDDAALAAALGCAPAVLTQLRLCRRPGEAEPSRTVEEDVAQIAGRFGIDPAALRRAVEEAADLSAGGSPAPGPPPTPLMRLRLLPRLLPVRTPPGQGAPRSPPRPVRLACPSPSRSGSGALETAARRTC
jgi:hypothetical protein